MPPFEPWNTQFVSLQPRLHTKISADFLFPVLGPSTPGPTLDSQPPAIVSKCLHGKNIYRSSVIPSEAINSYLFLFQPLLLVDTVLCFLFKLILESLLRCILYLVYCGFTVFRICIWISLQMHILPCLLLLSWPHESIFKEKKKGTVFRPLTSVTMGS